MENYLNDSMSFGEFRSLIDQLAAAAEREGTTQKVIVCRALATAGYRVHPDDLADRSNHRRRRS